ncbi:MAG TPA: DUF2085 domain-containing protein [Herpetosiphonaceae bacterium]
MEQTPDILELARHEMAQRRVQEAQRAAEQQQPWLWAFLGLGLTLIGGVLFLPMGTLDHRLHMIVHGVCAQAHYLTIGGYTMPLCARNTGIYAGFLATVLYLLVLGRGRAAKMPPLSITIVLGLAVIIMGIDGFNSLLLDIGGYNVYTPQNYLRVITGLGMGIAIGTFFVLMFNLSLRYDARQDQRVLRNWPELLGMVATAALLYGLLFTAPEWLFYPLAIFSVLGIVGVLFVANMFVVAMLTGLEGRVLRFKQLSRPATFGLALTVGELALLAWLRVAMEQSLGIV